MHTVSITIAKLLMSEKMVRVLACSLLRYRAPALQLLKSNWRHFSKMLDVLCIVRIHLNTAGLGYFFGPTNSCKAMHLFWRHFMEKRSLDKWRWCIVSNKYVLGYATTDHSFLEEGLLYYLQSSLMMITTISYFFKASYYCYFSGTLCMRMKRWWFIASTYHHHHHM